MGSQVPPLPALVIAASAASTSPYCSSSIGHVLNFPGEVSKLESSYESSVEEMCGIEDFLNNGPGHFQPDLGGSQRKNDHPTIIVNVKRELVTSTYQSLVEPSPIRENRKEKDYCAEAPQQESFVDDTDMSSGLSGI